MLPQISCNFVDCFFCRSCDEKLSFADGLDAPATKELSRPEITIVSLDFDLDVHSTNAPEKIGDAWLLKFSAMYLCPNTADMLLKRTADFTLKS